ncbi:hypothetical protein WJX74_010191 [Apatococcus lobatus]|uniref:Uncharacterized protein n=1 Tax=Apatococcus lobatus TaxID=904363 RepID=A0AAW1RHW7_9CHLO
MLQQSCLFCLLWCISCISTAPAPGPALSRLPTPAPAPAPSYFLSKGDALQTQAPPPRVAKIPSSIPSVPNVAAFDASAIVNFTITLRDYTYSSWSGLDGTVPKGQDRYIYALNAWLQSNISSAAYARLTAWQAGSIEAETQAFVPYNSSNQSSVTAARSAAISLSATINSGTSSILDATIFGASSGIVTTPQGKF